MAYNGRETRKSACKPVPPGRGEDPCGKPLPLDALGRGSGKRLAALALCLRTRSRERTRAGPVEQLNLARTSRWERTAPESAPRKGNELLYDSAHLQPQIIPIW